MGLRIRWFNYTAWFIISLLLFLLVVCSPVNADTPATICTAAGYSSGYYISDGDSTLGTCTPDASCTSTVNNDFWGYGNYTIYHGVVPCGACGTSPCYDFVTVFSYGSEPTPSPTPTPSLNCTMRCGYTFSCSGDIICWFDQQTADALYLGIQLVGGTCDSSSLLQGWYSTLHQSNPCSNTFGIVNTTPTPTAEPTWYIIPDTTLPLPTQETLSPLPHPSVVNPTLTALPNPTATFTNITTITTFSTIPTVFPALPEYVNSSYWEELVCGNGTFSSRLYCGIMQSEKSLVDTVNNCIMFIVSLILSPLAIINSIVGYNSAMQSSIMQSWSGLAFVIVSVMSQIIVALPAKVQNVLTLIVTFDIMRQLVDMWDWVS